LVTIMHMYSLLWYKCAHALHCYTCCFIVPCSCRIICWLSCQNCVYTKQ